MFEVIYKKLSSDNKSYYIIKGEYFNTWEGVLKYINYEINLEKNTVIDIIRIKVPEFEDKRLNK